MKRIGIVTALAVAVFLTTGVLPDTLAAKKDQPLQTGKFVVTEDMHLDYCCIEMRDVTGKKWPVFWLAHPLGKGNIDTSNYSGSFTIIGEGAGAQLMGGSRQEKRLGGHLATVETDTDKKGLQKTRRVMPEIIVKVEVTGKDSAIYTVSFNGKTCKKKGTIAVSNSRHKHAPGLNLTCELETTVGELGIASGTSPVSIRVFAPARPST